MLDWTIHPSNDAGKHTESAQVLGLLSMAEQERWGEPQAEAGSSGLPAAATPAESSLGAGEDGSSLAGASDSNTRPASKSDSSFPTVSGFDMSTAGTSSFSRSRKTNGSSRFATGPVGSSGMSQLKGPPACIAGLRMLDLSSGSPQPSGSGSDSSGRLTPVSESGGSRSARGPTRALRKSDMMGDSPQASSLPASPGDNPWGRNKAKTHPRVSHADLHNKLVAGLDVGVGAHHSRHNSGSIKVSSALDDVVPALERILKEARLTLDQRNDLQYTLQIILSRTLYEPTVKSPSTPPSPRSNRRATLNLVSPKLELDEETQKWLAHEYRLDQYTIPDKYSLSMSLPNGFTNLTKTGSPVSRSFTLGRSTGLSPLASSSPRGRKQADESTPEPEKPKAPPPVEAPLAAAVPVEVQVALSADEAVAKELVASETAKVLEKMHELDFDVFELNTANQGAALKCLATAIFRELGLCEKLGIRKATMDAFLTAIQAGYRQVPYHNGCHAADVLHSTYVFLHRCCMEEWMKDEEVLSLLIAAIIHDFKHPGISNAFLIASRDPLAVLYNDRAVLENHHLASAFGEMYTPGQDILAHLSVEQQKTIRTRIIQLVLITDMSEHFEFAARFKSRVLGPGHHIEKEENRLCLMQMVLKCADLNSAAKPQELAKDWASRIMTEFFNQGDQEKKLGLPVSPMCDKDAANIPKQQLRFIEFIVQPLYEMLAEHCQAVDEWLRGLEANKTYWQSQMNDEQPLHSDKLRRVTSSKIG